MPAAAPLWAPHVRFGGAAVVAPIPAARDLRGNGRKAFLEGAFYG